MALRLLTWTPPHWPAGQANAAEVPQPVQLVKVERPETVAAPTGFERGPVSAAIGAGSYAGPDSFMPEVMSWQGGLRAMAPMILPIVQRVAIPVGVPVGYMAEAGNGTQPPQGYRQVWLAGLGNVLMPEGMAARIGNGPAPGDASQEPALAANYGGQTVPAAPAPVPLSPGLAESRKSRWGKHWSMDAWSLVRKESATALTSGRPLYGGSQAGTVIRYKLAPQSPHRPMAYLRTTTALGKVRQSEIALGLAARPFASVPVVAAAEARAYRGPIGGTQYRPAAMAYTELPPFRMPLGFTGETYLQAGYVGGTFGTGFVDGQLRVDRQVLELAGGRLSLGGGIWGGAQAGASRLDIGPGATASLNVAGVPSRVSMDWRFRLLGNSDPESGPAVTISAGF
ncbi:hypothetical protein MB02_00875 [Croceicoccus estronivorus]|nr:hypothetical protein MB02_00875 [Croceicoccus estronivorus]